MKVVVSGGLGFIGSRLARAYALRGDDVHVLDALHPQVHASDRALHEVAQWARVTLGDVRDAHAWEHVLADAELVLHMAAETGTGQSMDEIARYTDVNVTGTAIMLEAIARAGCVRTIFLPSSRAVYGEGTYRCELHGLVYPTARIIDAMRVGAFEVRCAQCDRAVTPVPVPESWEPRPVSVYATTKLAQEHLVMQHGAARGIDVRIARYQNVYGPGQALGNPYTGVLMIFAQQLLAGTELNIYEDGAIARDFVYIDDVVDATLAIVDAKMNPGITNVGTGIATTLLDVVERFASALGRAVPHRISGDFRAGDIRHAAADVTRLRALGFTPRTAMRDGLAAVL